MLRSMRQVKLRFSTTIACSMLSISCSSPAADLATTVRDSTEFVTVPWELQGDQTTSSAVDLEQYDQGILYESPKPTVPLVVDQVSGERRSGLSTATSFAAVLVDDKCLTDDELPGVVNWPTPRSLEDLRSQVSGEDLAKLRLLVESSLRTPDGWADLPMPQTKLRSEEEYQTWAGGRELHAWTISSHPPTVTDLLDRGYCSDDVVRRVSISDTIERYADAHSRWSFGIQLLEFGYMEERKWNPAQFVAVFLERGDTGQWLSRFGEFLWEVVFSSDEAKLYWWQPAILWRYCTQELGVVERVVLVELYDNYIFQRNFSLNWSNSTREALAEVGYSESEFAEAFNACVRRNAFLDVELPYSPEVLQLLLVEKLTGRVGEYLNTAENKLPDGLVLLP